MNLPAVEAPPPFDRDALEHSRPVRWDRTADTAGAAAAFAALLAELEQSETRTRRRKANAQARLSATLTAFVLDLFAEAKADPALFLVYSRDENAYAPSRYGSRFVTSTAVLTVADFLLAAGYAEGARGFLNRSANPFGGTGGVGRRSRIRATPRLVAFLDAHGITTGDLGTLKSTETIHLKSRAGRRQTKPLIEYADTPETHAMRAELAAVNGLLSRTLIELEPGATADDADSGAALDRTAVSLHRVFNEGSFAKGGRFYGGWWQRLGSAARAGLRLNGEATVELDFRSLHTRLCYQLEGQPLPLDVDPYVLDGEPQYPRELVKDALNRLISAAPGRTLRAPKGTEKERWRGLLAILPARHSAIARWFGAERVLELQRYDSDITAAVLTDLTAQGIPCLPVHDSFIVRRSDEVALGVAMNRAYWEQAERFGAATALPAIAGWSSPAVETEVRSMLAFGEAG